MDLPAEVHVTNDMLGVKNGKGTLVAINEEGFYEMRLTFNNRQHKVLLPIQSTTLIFRVPEPEYEEIEIER